MKRPPFSAGTRVGARGHQTRLGCFVSGVPRRIEPHALLGLQILAGASRVVPRGAPIHVTL